MLNTVPRIAVRQVVLGAPGRLADATITPNTNALPGIPNRIAAADVVNAAAWTFSDNTTVGFPIQANFIKHLPGSFLKDTIFAAGTYYMTFYLDA